MFCRRNKSSSITLWPLSITLASALWLLAIVPVAADQHAKALPGLFEQLLDAADQSEVTRIESEIWQHWLEAPDTASEVLMSQISHALAARELDIALALCNQLIDGSPDFSEAWNKRATVHYLLGNNSASVDDIRETLAREPRHFGAISGLGLIFLREKNLEAALEAFKQVLQISPNSASARSSAERVRSELGREI